MFNIKLLFVLKYLLELQAEIYLYAVLPFIISFSKNKKDIL